MDGHRRWYGWTPMTGAASPKARLGRDRPLRPRRCRSGSPACRRPGTCAYSGTSASAGRWRAFRFASIMRSLRAVLTSSSSHLMSTSSRTDTASRCCRRACWCRRSRPITPQCCRIGRGLYGAIEIEHLAGPCFAEQDYEVRGEVLAVGETPRTEYLWYESILSDPSGGEGLARMLMMLRFMKDSSPAWQ